MTQGGGPARNHINPILQHIGTYLIRVLNGQMSIINSLNFIELLNGIERVKLVCCSFLWRSLLPKISPLFLCLAIDRALSNIHLGYP